MLSELQHFAFCRRQWALIHIDQQWQDNDRTADGSIMHRRAHDEKQIERRGDIITMRGLHVRSNALGAVGICDVVEFCRDPSGISLPGYDGLWLPYPVEYKRGAPKSHDADELQLCAQAMCLEEMLLCSIPEGSLFYGETRRRTRVAFDEPLRDRVASMLGEMRAYAIRGHIPKAKPTKGCSACSLKEICLPALHRTGKVSDYLQKHLQEEEKP